jgi:hypothetical protein
LSQIAIELNRKPKYYSNEKVTIMTVLLLDDERSFKDGRSSLVARSTFEAIKFTDALTELDELWLDYVLIGTDSTDEFLFHLLNRKRNGNPLALRTVYIHTSSYMAVGLLKQLLTNLGVAETDMHVVDHKEYMVVNR